MQNRNEQLNRDGESNKDQTSKRGSPRKIRIYLKRTML